MQAPQRTLVDEFSGLLERRKEIEEFAPVEDRFEALRDLAMWGKEGNHLGVAAAWRLDERSATRLEMWSGYTPTGGWGGLVALAAGTPMIHATRQEFRVVDTRPIIGKGHEECRRMLLETFTEMLVPPSIASGLFMMVGLHPAWGLRVAKACFERNRPSNADGEFLSTGWESPEIFPAENLEIGTRMLFSVVSAIIASLRRLPEGSKYSIDAFCALVTQIVDSVLARTEENEEVGGLRLLIEPARKHRVLDIVVQDLLGAYLVPAGAARTFDDRTFAIAPGALDGVTVNGYTPEEQAEILDELLEIN